MARGIRQAELISRQIKLRHLRILVEVARSGSMVKAGKHLGVSQPVVSKGIADLEGSLGVRLLDRTPQGVEPTLYGRALIKRSVAIFDDLRTSVSEIDFLTDAMSGELRIGAAEGMASGLLPIIVGRLGRRHPRVSFDVVVTDRARLQNDLRDRRVDLLIGNYSSDIEDDLQAIVLGDARQHVIAARKSRWGSRRSVRLADLMEERWCLPPSDHPVRIAFNKECERQGIASPAAVITVGSPQIVATMVAQFGYLGVLGAIVLNSNSRGSQLKKLPIAFSMQSVSALVITLKNRTLSPLAQLFIDEARQVASELSRT